MLSRNDKTPVAAGLCQCLDPCVELCVQCCCDIIKPSTEKQPSLTPYPSPTTAEEKFIRSYRDRVHEFEQETGDKRALSVSEGLTSALTEGGCRP